MNILSLRESDAVAGVADSLCRLIEGHIESLRETRLGKSFNLEGVHFRLFKSDRNVIYRLRAESCWFLKIPRSGNQKMLRREILGAAAVTEALEGHPSYRHADAIRASIDKGYVLYAEVPGPPLNAVFYRACLAPLPGSTKRVEEVFGTFGNVLAHLHQNEVQDDEPLTKKGASAMLRFAIGRIKEPDAVSRAIVRWAEEQVPQRPVALVHGHLRFDSVLVSNDRLCLIDFEDCGRGSIYDDLSFACSHVLVTRAVVLFPSSRARVALSSFLRGYRGRHEYRQDLLLQGITMHMSRTYISAHCSAANRATVAGLPLSKSRLQRLVMGLLRGDADSVSAEIDV